MSIANATMIRQGTEVDKSEAMKLINIINAEAYSNATLIENRNRAVMTKNTITTESKTFGEAKTQLAFTTNKDMLDYIFFLNL